MRINDIINEDSPTIGDILAFECNDTLVETTIIDLVDDGLVLSLDETALNIILSSRRKLNEEESFRWKDSGEPMDTFRDLLDFVKVDRQRHLIQAMNSNFSQINKEAKMLHTNPSFYSKPKTKRELLARQLLLRVTEPDGRWKQDMGFKTADNPEGDDPETYIPKFWKMRPASLRETGAPAPHRLNPEPDYAMTEAEYQGRKVTLGKPFLTPDGPKKRSVYVKNSKGNVVKVNFGQKGVKIKKSNPARRKSFRARHNCATAKDRTTPRYWSCKFW